MSNSSTTANATITVTSGHVQFSDILECDDITCVTYEALVKSVLKLKGTKRVTDVSPNPPRRTTLRYLHHVLVLEPGRTSSTGNELEQVGIEQPSRIEWMNLIHEWEYFFRHVTNHTGRQFARLAKKKKKKDDDLFSHVMSSVFEKTLLKENRVEPQPIKTLFIRGGGQHGSCLMGVAARVTSTEPFERFAGASFGAAIAALLALRLNILDQLVHVCESMGLGHPDGFERRLDGDVALAFVLGLFPNASVDVVGVQKPIVEQTLGELNLDLDIVVTRVSDLEPVVLNATTAPHVRLVDALRASMGIPIFIGCCEIDGTMYMDGDLTSYTYIEGLSEDSVVVGLEMGTTAAAARTCLFDESLLSTFIGEGSLIEKVKFLFDHFLVWFRAGYDFVGRARRAYVTIRDPSISICGGPTGSTSWHLLNFDHGAQ